jgi:alanyl-tRNA synthetase
MKMLTSAEIRQQFLDFFAEHGHAIVPSASLVPADDPTLLFTNAGMNQFKDVFLGVGTRPYKRAADTQKCMRVAGKHNDLEDVGRDTRHHTMFEMLGNWSFGDYYKKEAIAWAWDLLTQVWELPKDRLWATCFKDDKGDLETDEEAAGYWRAQHGIDPSHVLYFGRKDNFWEMGDTGPCGPCSEIHYDRGPGACEKHGVPGHVCGVNGDCGRYFEIWNLVFIQYNRVSAKQLDPLPARHVDTGMGFERMVSILQGEDSNYKTDLFMPLMRRTQEMLGHTNAQVEDNIVAYRVIADHGRAVTFLIGDGVLPGNVGRSYVLRMILRRAARFGRKIGFTQPFLAGVADAVIETMGQHFTELVTRRDYVLRAITDEEERFQRTLDLGLARLDSVLATLEDQIVPGVEAFKLYDTFGLPLEITRDVAEERGFFVDEQGFQEALAGQREKAKSSEKFELDDKTLSSYSNAMRQLQENGSLGAEGVEHDPYTTTEMETMVIGLLVDGQLITQAKPGDQVEVILPATPFYVESGGQMADTGMMARLPQGAAQGDGTPLWEIAVSDTRRPVPGLIVHLGEVHSGRPRVGEPCWALVDADRRWDIMRNHTATHLLHSQLRQVLGTHVQQAGSLVAPDRLRFDFTHSAMLTQDELDTVIENVNDLILTNYPVNVHYENYKDAVGSGAMALFGEKYGDVVRVIRTGWPGLELVSQELCGGTHVTMTAEIGPFLVVSEGSVGAGIRRIEAVTGRGAQDLILKRLNKMNNAAAYLLCAPDELDRKVQDVLEQLQAAQKELTRTRREMARRDLEALMDKVQTIGGVPVLAAQVSAADVDALREMTDWYRARVHSGVIVLGAAIEGRPQIVAAVTEDLTGRGLHAGRLAGAVAKVVGGGGGGKPTLAQAGGRDSKRLAEALMLVPGLVSESLS